LKGKSNQREILHGRGGEEEPKRSKSETKGQCEGKKVKLGGGWGETGVGNADQE